MYQLKITIRDSKPPIWRRVLVPEQIPFSELHAVIQLAFGWNDEHLYMFEKGRKGDPGSEYRVWGEDESMGNAAITPLWAAIQNEGDKLVYTYDFGDWWDCVIVLEKQPGRVVLEFVLHEGRNRQIRRMCSAVGLQVVRLRRSAEGPVKLGMLQPGEYRELKKSEINALRNAAMKSAGKGESRAASPARRPGPLKKRTNSD